MLNIFKTNNNSSTSSANEEKSPASAGSSARKSISNFLRKSLSFNRSASSSNNNGKSIIDDSKGSFNNGNSKGNSNRNSISLESFEQLQAQIRDVDESQSQYSDSFSQSNTIVPDSVINLDHQSDQNGQISATAPPGSPTKDGGILLSILATQKKRYSARLQANNIALTNAAVVAAAAVKQQDIKEYANILQQLIIQGDEEQFKQALTKQHVALYNSDLDTLFRFQEKMTLTHLAARYDRVEILTYLYEELGAFLESHDGNGATPLFYAIANNCNKASVFLLSKGVQADCKDATGTIPFLIALKNGDYESMDMLLMFKIDINGKGLRGNTALHIACAEGNSSKVKFLLDRNAQPTRSNNRGQTPLACALGSIMVLRELFEHMDNNNLPITKYLGMKDEEGATLMHHCVENGFIDSANYILEYLSERYANSNAFVNRRSVANAMNISLNSPASGGSASNGNSSPVAAYSPSQANAKNGAFEVHPLTSILAEKELLAGNTVMHLAVKHKREDFVQLFLSYSSYFDVNAQNKVGNTPLHVAVIMKYEEIAKLLVSKGFANVKAKNAKKETPAQLAKANSISLIEEGSKDSNKRKSLFAFFTKK